MAYWPDSLLQASLKSYIGHEVSDTTMSPDFHNPCKVCRTPELAFAARSGRPLDCHSCQVANFNSCDSPKAVAIKCGIDIFPWLGVPRT